MLSLSLDNRLSVNEQEKNLDFARTVGEFFNEVYNAISRRDVEELTTLLSHVIDYINDEDSIVSFKLGNIHRYLDGEFTRSSYDVIGYVETIREDFKELDRIVYEVVKSKNLVF